MPDEEQDEPAEYGDLGPIDAPLTAEISATLPRLLHHETA